MDRTKFFTSVKDKMFVFPTRRDFLEQHKLKSTKQNFLFMKALRRLTFKFKTYDY